MDQAKRRSWITRVVAILSIAAIGMMAMYMEIDGIWVPILATAGISGVAGYEIGGLTGRILKKS